MSDEGAQSSRLACVLMPGLHGTGGLFDGFAAAAPRRYEPLITAYPKDQPLSYEQLVPIIVEMLPAECRFLMVAESFAGPLALRVAADAPPGLAGLVLCNTFVRPPVWTGWRHAPLGLLLRMPIPGFIVRRYLVGPSADRDMVDKARAAIRQTRPGVLAARIRAVLTVDATQWLAECPVPVLCLRGSGDRLIGERCLDRMDAVKGDLQTQVLDGPHLLLQTCPHESWTALDAFASLLPATPARGG